MGIKLVLSRGRSPASGQQGASTLQLATGPGAPPAPHGLGCPQAEYPPLEDPLSILLQAVSGQEGGVWQVPATLPAHRMPARAAHPISALPPTLLATPMAVSSSHAIPCTLTLTLTLGPVFLSHCHLQPFPRSFTLPGTAAGHYHASAPVAEPSTPALPPASRPTALA